MTIERFAGYPVQNWGGPLPGGGYRGATDELDALVARAADMLVREYGRDVVIRFNSDRRSGGAWLRDADTRDTLVSLGAGYGKDRTGLTQEQIIAMSRLDHDRLPDVLYISTYIAADALTSDDWGTGQAGKYAYHYHESLDAGLAFLHANAEVV